VAAAALAAVVSVMAAGPAGAATSHHGSVAGTPLAHPVVAIAPTPSGGGYWLAASDGGIFAFGDAHFFGSTGGITLNRPIVGMAPTPTGRGYWLVASDGGIFAFGDAHFHGSAGGLALASPIVGIARTRSGAGYWMIAADGGVFAFGNAPFLGSATFGAHPTVGLAPSRSGGYWIATQSGAVHAASETGAFTVDPALESRRPEEAIATEMYARINAERRARGLRPVVWDAALAQLAAQWARHLATTNDFRHRDLGALLGNPLLGNRFQSAGENLYAGTGGAADSGSAHAALMGSDGHRGAMLTPEVQFVGVGAACAGGKLVVVEDFAIAWGSPLPRERPAPAPQPFVSNDGAGSRC
jgi:uncharacterized protein YkwD